MRSPAADKKELAALISLPRTAEDDVRADKKKLTTLICLTPRDRG